MKSSKNRYWVSESWPNNDPARDVGFDSFDELKEWLEKTYPNFAHNISISDRSTQETIYSSCWGVVYKDKFNLSELIEGESVKYSMVKYWPNGGSEVLGFCTLDRLKEFLSKAVRLDNIEITDISNPQQTEGTCIFKSHDGKVEIDELKLSEIDGFFEWNND